MNRPREHNRAVKTFRGTVCVQCSDCLISINTEIVSRYISRMHCFPNSNTTRYMQEGHTVLFIQFILSVSNHREGFQ